ncbi:hypothetical protein MNBD_GAMMA18-132 [hydrothermal vent metagenome]|uniref:Uncharacterized protein n=1 Tax=hydrothermal vent metagenome TaxID=652676 RepID=A0A3B0ZAJ3_9ZZZZ
MTLGDIIFAVIFAMMFIACILFVIFGQVTVRKLRKNPKTKHELGLELASGWDILNVAQALSIPMPLEKKIKNRAFHANANLLYKYTTAFDRVLARMFFWSWASSGFALIILGTLHWFGVLD